QVLIEGGDRQRLEGVGDLALVVGELLALLDLVADRLDAGLVDLLDLGLYLGAQPVPAGRSAGAAVAVPEHGGASGEGAAEQESAEDEGDFLHRSTLAPRRGRR